MTSKSIINRFNKIYDDTYLDIQKFIVIKCHNINDVNDIIQETYLEFWNILNRKNILDNNIKSYLIGIAINKIKKHYTVKQKIKTISLFAKNNNDTEIIDTIAEEINIDDIIIRNNNWDIIWKYLKNKKNQNIPKIFYLHYYLDLSIKEIANTLEVQESYVKNIIYRTLKELQTKFGNKGGSHEE